MKDYPAVSATVIKNQDVPLRYRQYHVLFTHFKGSLKFACFPFQQWLLQVPKTIFNVPKHSASEILSEFGVEQ